MESLELNRTWYLVDLPPGCKSIDCKWILKKKLKPDGTLNTFKVRLVANGFKRKKEKKDFFDTFHPYTKEHTEQAHILRWTMHLAPSVLDLMAIKAATLPLILHKTFSFLLLRFSFKFLVLLRFSFDYLV